MNETKNKHNDFDEEEEYAKYIKHLNEHISTVTFKERSTGKIHRINPRIDDSFWDDYIRAHFQTGEYELLEGTMPEKWKPERKRSRIERMLDFEDKEDQNALTVNKEKREGMEIGDAINYIVLELGLALFVDSIAVLVLGIALLVCLYFLNFH